MFRAYLVDGAGDKLIDGNSNALSVQSKVSVSIEWEDSVIEGLWSPATEVLTEFKVKYGFTFDHPDMPHVATTGTCVFFYDNLALNGSGYPQYSVPSPVIEPTFDASQADLGTKYRVKVTHDTDRYLFYGKVTDWNPVPGVFDDRVTEVILEDAIGQLSRWPSSGRSVASNQNAAQALSSLASLVSDTNNLTSTGEVFTYLFHDFQIGETRQIKAPSNIAGSEIGHFYADGETLYYNTNDEWINRGRGSIGTFDNRFLSLDIGRNKDLERGPIFVTYYPADVSDSNEILFSLNRTGNVKPGETTYLTINYTDPDNKSTTIAVIDTDVISPVSGTDYLVTYTEGSTDNGASSDLTINLTNKGSAAELEFINSNTSQDLYLSLLQVRGKPIRIYDKESLRATGIGNNKLTEKLRYCDNNTLAQQILTFRDRIYGRSTNRGSIASSITFMATADSDTMQMAMLGEIGKSFDLTEDVNILSGVGYRITGVEWDFIDCETIIVTWDIFPEDYTALEMATTDSDGVSCYMVDSDDNKLSFWR